MKKWTVCFHFPRNWIDDYFLHNFIQGIKYQFYLSAHFRLHGRCCSTSCPSDVLWRPPASLETVEDDILSTEQTSPGEDFEGKLHIWEIPNFPSNFSIRRSTTSGVVMQFIRSSVHNLSLYSLRTRCCASSRLQSGSSMFFAVRSAFSCSLCLTALSAWCKNSMFCLYVPMSWR